MRNALLAMLLLVLGCDSSGSTPTDRLCQGSHVCRNVVRMADQVMFTKPQTAITFGLAHLHMRNPQTMGIGTVIAQRVGNQTAYQVVLREHTEIPVPNSIVARLYSYQVKESVCTWPRHRTPAYSQRVDGPVELKECAVIADGGQNEGR